MVAGSTSWWVAGFCSVVGVYKSAIHGRGEPYLSPSVGVGGGFGGWRGCGGWKGGLEAFGYVWMELKISGLDELPWGEHKRVCRPGHWAVGPVKKEDSLKRGEALRRQEPDSVVS